MRDRVFVLVAAMVGITVAAAICGDQEELRSPRTIAVDELTFEDVQERALAAVQQPGTIYHLAATVGAEHYTDDIWLDLAQPVARRQPREGETVDLQYAGRHAMVHDERFYDGSCEECGITEAARFAPHLDYILSTDPKSHSIDAGIVDGQPTIIVRIKREAGGETDGDVSATIHLGEDFLPIKMSVDPPGRSPYATTFTNEFLAPSALPADFFSPESLQALAGGPRSDIEEAIAAGLDVYWLGDAFEQTILRDGSRYYADIASGELNLEYGPSDDFVPSPCARITIVSSEWWEQAERETAGSGFVPNLGNVVIDGTASTPAGPAILYRSAIVPPRAEVTVLVPPGQALPTQPRLPEVAADDGAARFAVVEGDDSVTIVATNCGPTGSNIYRTDDAFRRVLDGLRRYAD